MPHDKGWRKSRAKTADNLMTEDQPFSFRLQTNADLLKEIFYYPTNLALKVRNLYIPLLDREGMVFYWEDSVDTQTIEAHIVGPLLQTKEIAMDSGDIATLLTKHVLTAASSKKISFIQEAIDELINGNTVLFTEGYAHALSISTTSFEGRTISLPTVENAVKGPKEAFIESASVNRSLIRKHVREHDLICELITVGERAPKQVSMMYLHSIADSELIEGVKKRIMDIDTDTIMNLSMLEQHLEERPYSLFPSILATERPDRAASFMYEGHIVLIMDNSPLALIVPVTFWALFQTGEDWYLRWAYGNFIRLIRLISVFVALFTPSLYIAAVTFHVEMIPPDLMLAIAATRERVPFPTLVEVLIMEVSFEILREAGIRIPSVIGPTIGILGALILGQAAVQANIVSPILVVIVAITGLSSFAIPEISFNFGIRILRFLMLFVAFFTGFFGIGLLSTFLVAYMVSLKSFGVPFLSPMAPFQPSAKDLLYRPILRDRLLRPFYASPQDQVRQKKTERKSSR
ncbi:spore germination protein [Ammoniphilus resinae]|uniref:Spore germination protein KA n=1 Tax=Ammoniphilus resinae TaxID=861532 RepID=A0ABS4GVT9_9BACL|nr:spore germination protein [Ammoniphilus resinae]MBP1934380.1 spore germination protein KA [Ammoniphilus resinae]